MDYHFEASEYEKKLIQVAEMHGELLEFNEHLQRVAQQKEAAMARMRQELEALRGPLPEDLGRRDERRLGSARRSVSLEQASLDFKCIDAQDLCDIFAGNLN